MAAHDTVQVAVRVRPLVESEIEKGSRMCLETHCNESQITFRSSNQGFTFNYVFDHNSQQEDIYKTSVKGLIKQLFKGYNVTILAYGQTGSGKTFTMGTNYNPSDKYGKGIIPQAVEDIFRRICCDNEWEYVVTASFIELYQEQLYDLLSGRVREQSVVDIREDTRGICIPNLTEVRVHSTEDTFSCLQQGSFFRATGSTAMNATSSRSHAIFTVSLNFNRRENVDEAMTAKFHLVDLAGSERPKKTKATGQTFKEGVNINKGLLALGNVISALGDGNHSYISYRDSKLTRLLQDSLGGNSQTLMIACISPADYNQEETISTLRYADRARRIKNRPIVNQDPKAAEISKLKREVERLQLELLGNGGGGINGENGSSCPPEHLQLHDENTVLKSTVKKLTDALGDSLNQNTNLFERALIAEKARDRFNEKLYQLGVEYEHTLESFNHSKDISHLEPLHELQTKIKELQEEHKRSEDEILNHQMESSSPAPTSETQLLNSENNNMSHPNTPKEEIRLRENHIFEQAQLGKELQALTKNLAYKEELAKQLAASSTFMVDTRTECEGQMKELEDQIHELQRERNELSDQIKSMQQNTATNKLAEQRRKRLQELEQKIALLNKKVTEQGRVIKMKESSDLKITNLNREILAMKQAKVRLIQQMKSESERFRTLRVNRERELCKLREQDRRRQNQMQRMETLHNKQQNVLKRKVEEAAAVNKRLKDALAMKNAAMERQANNGKERNVFSWVDHELEMIVSTAEAEQTLHNLINDRAALSKELSALRKSLHSTELHSSNRKTLEKEIESLSCDIELRSTQIADMQQKIMDCNEENKSKNHLDQLHTMVEAKCAIKHLFGLAAEAKKESANKSILFIEAKEAFEDVQKKLDDCKNQINELEVKHHKELHELEKENEEKVYLLLRQLNEKDNKVNGVNGTHLSDAQLLERIKIQDAELEKLDSLRCEVETMRERSEMLAAELEEARKVKSKPKLKGPNTIQEPRVGYKHLLPEDDDEEVDDENDPDWRNTPIMKRLRALKVKQPTGPNEDVLGGGPIKRGSDGVPRCGCSGDCGRRTCRCRKSGSLCSSSCKCNENCTNMDNSKNSSSSSDNGDNKENSTSEHDTTNIQMADIIDDASFKKPRVLSPKRPNDFAKRKIFDA